MMSRLITGVDLLRHYSKHEPAGQSVIARIRAAAPVKTPDETRNTRQLTMRFPRLADEQVSELIAAYLEGNSVYVLARRYGVH